MTRRRQSSTKLNGPVIDLCSDALLAATARPRDITRQCTGRRKTGTGRGGDGVKFHSFLDRGNQFPHRLIRFYRSQKSFSRSQSISSIKQNRFSSITENHFFDPHIHFLLAGKSFLRSHVIFSRGKIFSRSHSILPPRGRSNCLDPSDARPVKNFAGYSGWAIKFSLLLRPDYCERAAGGCLVVRSGTRRGGQAWSFVLGLIPNTKPGTIAFFTARSRRGGTNAVAIGTTTTAITDLIAKLATAKHRRMRCSGGAGNRQGGGRGGG